MYFAITSELCTTFSKCVSIEEPQRVKTSHSYNLYVVISWTYNRRWWYSPTRQHMSCSVTRTWHMASTGDVRTCYLQWNLTDVLRY